MKTILVILLVLFSLDMAYCQFPGNPDQQRGNDVSTNTNNKTKSTDRDSTTIVSNSFFDIFYGNPGKAAFYGLIIPGGGQIYNKKWWKLPFVYTVEGGTIFWIFYSTQNYNGYQNAYTKTLKGIENDGFNDITDVNILKSRRDSWRKQREYSWIFFLGGHLITIFEGFIDRHLMEFDVSDDLTLAPIPSMIGPIPSVTYTIPLNKKNQTQVPKVWID